MLEAPTAVGLRPLPSTALARLRPADVLVLGKGRLSAFPVGGRRDGGPFQALAGRRVAVLFEQSAAGDRGLEAALALARVIAGELAVIVGAAEPDALSERRALAAARLAESRAGVRHAFIRLDDPAALARTVRAHRVGALVLSGAAAVRPTAEFLEEVACPVVLLP